MLLAMDVGNTNITAGVFNGKDLWATFRMTTKAQRTSDEFGIDICDLLMHNHMNLTDITGIIIASVVPDVNHSLASAIKKYFKIQPMFVNYKMVKGFTLKTDDPAQVGADRIVDAVAAYTIYGGPIIVIDYGTATTYDVMNEKGEFIAAVTAPGIRTSAQALWNKAAKLPSIEIRKPKSILAKNTITSMQAGLLYGQIGQTEYIINKIKEELHLEDINVVATGGLGTLLEKETESIKYYDANLTLEGMRIIYEMQ